MLELPFRLHPEGWKSDFCRKRGSAKLPIDGSKEQSHLLNFDTPLKGEEFLQRPIHLITAKTNQRLSEQLYLTNLYALRTMDGCFAMSIIEHDTFHFGVQYYELQSFTTYLN